MIFAVPEDFKGSFVLGTLNKALSRGMTISITGNKLYAPDVKMAIQRGSLVPVGDDYNDEMASLSHDIVIANKTDRVLVLGDIVLKPWGALPVSRDALESASVRAAATNGFINVVSQEAPKKPKKDKKDKKKVVEVVEEVEEEVFDEEAEKFIPGSERQVKAKVWNFREQESVDAQIVPTTPDIINVMEDEHEDLDFVDEPVEPQQVEVDKKATKKKTTKKAVKKTTKKKAVKKTIKKKVLATKKKKVKAIEPVGDKKIPKTQMDAIVELDSRGRPIENASDALNHLIDSLNAPADISFVDSEQAQDRYDSRTDMD